MKEFAEFDAEIEKIAGSGNPSLVVMVYPDKTARSYLSLSDDSEDKNTSLARMVASQLMTIARQADKDPVDFVNEIHRAEVVEYIKACQRVLDDAAVLRENRMLYIPEKDEFVSG